MSARSRSGRRTRPKLARVVATRISEQEHQELVRAAELTGLSASDLLRAWVRERLDPNSGAELAAAIEGQLLEIPQLSERVGRVESTLIKMLEHLLLNLTDAPTEDVRALISEEFGASR